MPFLWSKLKRKHNTPSSKRDDKNGITNDRDNPLHYANENTKELRTNIPIPNGQNSVLQTQPQQNKYNLKYNVREHYNKSEIINQARQYGEPKNNGDISNIRFPVYKIFGDEYSLKGNINQQKSGYQYTFDVDKSPGVQYANKHFFLRKEDRDIDCRQVQLRPKRSNIFGGLVPRFHRYSLPEEVLRYGNNVIKRPEIRKCDTMSGYVPRVVSLHDTSAILSGRVIEKPVPSKQRNAKVLYVPNTRNNKSRLPNMFLYNPPRSSNQRQSVATTVQQSKVGVHYIINNSKNPKVKNQPSDKSPSSNLNRSQQPSSKVTSFPSNNNFYFTSSMLSHIQTRLPDIDDPISENTNTVAALKLDKDTSTNLKVQSRNREREIGYNKQISKSTEKTFFLDKADVMNNIGSTATKNIPSSIERKNQSHNEENNDDSNYVILHKSDDVNSIPNGVDQLDAMFNTEGDLFY